MLTKCPECGLQVSDKAFSCPHCGYPFKNNIAPVVRKSTKKRRLPNGFGQITELKNRNLKKPFRAMITTGFDENARPIQKLLKPVAYFSTYNEAYEALLKYNKNPYSYDSSMTLVELFQKWYPAYEKTVGKKTTMYVRSTWNRFEPLWNTKICNLRKSNVKMLLDNTDASPTNISNMKRLLKLMFDYAVEYEIVENNVIKEIDLSSLMKTKTSNYTTQHRAFSEDDLQKLWANINADQYVKIILIQCYMGWRPNELLNLKKENVNLEDGYIIGGSKTKNGINRKVPIHSKIMPLVIELDKNNDNTEFLISIKNKKIDYQTYGNHYEKILKELGIDPTHKLHDPRVTFVTLCKKYQVDEYAIKYMVGHSIRDLTENTYTKREFDWLKSEIEKIK